MKTIHFIYVLPGTKNLIKKIYRRITRKELLRYNTINKYKWPMPLRAPASITYNVGLSLEKEYIIKYYDWSEQLIINPNEGDVLLGHISPQKNTVLRNSIDNIKFSKIILLQPYNSDEKQVGWINEFLPKCDKFIAICGDYWIDKITDSPLKKHANKITNINMAVDVKSYPKVKNNFNPKGKRKFLYIGRMGRYGDEKGITLLEKLAETIPNFVGGYICDGVGIKGWTKISSPTVLSPELMKNIAEQYDIFINMSRADAQATTILEAMSWGFPVACTRETGYSKEKEFFYLSISDMEYNKNIINKIQNLTNKQLEDISKINQILVNENYSWENFNNNLKNIFKKIF